MKLITILLLCSGLLLSLAQEETTQEIDCNDEYVFQAVDAALKKYNAGNQTGNQFVLYRVTEGTNMVSDCLTLRSLVIHALWHGSREREVSSPWVSKCGFLGDPRSHVPGRQKQQQVEMFEKNKAQGNPAA